MSGVRWSPEYYAAKLRQDETRAGKKAATTDAQTIFRVKLPFPPTLNHAYELNADGSRRLSLEARAFRENAVAIARMEFEAAGHAMLVGKVSVAMTFMPPNARCGDVDNREKAVLDALQEAGIFANDRQVRHLEATMLDPMLPGEGSTQVIVRTL